MSSKIAVHALLLRAHKNSIRSKCQHGLMEVENDGCAIGPILVTRRDYDHVYD